RRSRARPRTGHGRVPGSNGQVQVMRFIQPPDEELTYLRADPLLCEQELDVRPRAADAIERAAGKRCGRVYWLSRHDHLYALELPVSPHASATRGDGSRDRA